MNFRPSIRLFRLLAASLALLLAAVLMPGRALAEAAPATAAGAWMVTEAADSTNVGLRFYFSPDGIFFLVDPRTQIGAAGTYSFGRAGLTVNVFGYGKTAEFIGGDISVTGDTMRIDVQRSGIMSPQRIVLKRIPLPPPAQAPGAVPVR